MSNGSQNGNGTAVMKRKRKEKIDVPHRYVDFHANANDFLCVMLAACGWSTRAIAEHTGLTEGQVMYRIGKAEQGRRKGENTQRMQYRQGRGGIAQSIVTTITGRGSMVKREIETTLDKRGLFEPRATGVLRHDARTVKKT